MSDFMSRAMALAKRGLGRTTPNPSVGAVLVVDGEVIGEGRTQPPPGVHAEIMALRDCTDRGRSAAGATLHVTLEPCCFVGRTGACTTAIIKAGVKRVIIGVKDPHERVNGKGIEALEAAGVEVVLLAPTSECDALILPFKTAITTQMPVVTCKVACSLDGNIATVAGESKWITSEAARADGRTLRQIVDGIVVGINTVLADNPRLTSRGTDGRDPRPVIFDTHLRTPVDAAVLQGPRRAILVCAPGATGSQDADKIEVELGDDGRIHLPTALRALVEHDLFHLLVEGGGLLHNSFLRANLVNHLVLYQSGLVITGGRSWNNGPPAQSLAKSPRLRLASVQRFPDELRTLWTEDGTCSLAW